MDFARRFTIGQIFVQIIIVLLFALVPVEPLLSQVITSDVSQYSHTSWLSRDGPFLGNLNSVAQTKDGYIWIGSGFSLLRFDGIEFLPWRPPEGQALSLLPIEKVLGARNGSLWIGGKGLGHLKDGRLTMIPALDGTQVSAILEDRAGDIWAGGLKRGPGNKLCRIHGEQAECFGDSTMFGMWIRSLFEDKDGTLWVGAETGLWKWGPGAPQLFSDNDTTAASSIVRDSKGTLLMAKSSEIHFLSDQGKNQVYPLRVGGKSVGADVFLIDRKGGLWIGTGRNGLVHVFDGRVDTYTINDGLSSDTVVDLFEDREGDIWAATANGLDRFRSTAIVSVTRRQGLSGSPVYSVLADGRALWVGSMNGLDRITSDTITPFGKKDGLVTPDTGSLYAERPGTILVASAFPDGLAWLSNGRASRLHSPSGENNFVITTDGDKGLWLSNRESGLIHMPKENRAAEVFPWDVFGNHSATAMAFDPKKRGLWLAFSPGALVFFQAGQIKERYLLDRNEDFTNPRDLQVDPDGTVWVGSNAGLTRLRNGKLATLTSRNGLPCDGVHWRKDDDQHFTWLQTVCGIVKLAPGELDRWASNPDRKVKVSTYLDYADGAENIVFGNYYSPSVTTTPDGRVAFVTTTGLAVIDPHENVMNVNPPPVYIEHLEGDAESYPFAHEVDLPPHVHVIRLRYVALSFRTPQKNRYRYKLEGYDRDWSEVLSTREAVYTNLPPGKYRFHVIAANDSGVWNTVGDTLDFTVRAAFYQTGWFHLIVLATAGVLVWIAYCYRIRYLYRQVSHRIEVQTNERLNVSRDLHDTLLQGVQGLILSFHALSEDPTLEQSVRRKIISLGDRAEETMEEAREKIRALRFEKQLDPSFARHVTSLASRLNPEESPVFSLSVVGQEVALKPLVYEEVCFICREALSNAFRHANAQKVEVAIGFEPSRFSLVIRDDGQGLEPRETLAASLNGHWGIVGMRERAGRIGAKFEIRNARPEHVPPGTAVVIEVPASIAYKSAAP